MSTVRTYTNYLNKFGISDEAGRERCNEIFDTIFHGSDSERFYQSVKDDMGYIEDTGNHDVRTEGMSYGMMMAVQMNRKDIFDRIWKWAKKNMFMENGPNAGYFCWSNKPDGTKNADGPAPDGEEYFAMALFFAARRWGDGEGIFNYTEQGREILRVAIHSDNKMWFEENHHIRFVPNCPFTDPSYHLPHFYELFAEYADPEDKEYWKAAAKASRKYLVKACHPETGLAAEYANDDGEPLPPKYHGTFFSDSYRVAANIGLDALWFGGNAALSKIASNIINFFDGKEADDLKDYMIDGTELKKNARHPVGLIATVAEAAAAVKSDDRESRAAAERAVKRLWDTPMRTGRRRYYDNCLYFFAILALSGHYVVY